MHSIITYLSSIHFLLLFVMLPVLLSACAPRGGNSDVWEKSYKTSTWSPSDAL